MAVERARMVAVFDCQIQANKDSSEVLPNGVKKYLN
jgi:hypothetical protein